VRLGPIVVFDYLPHLSAFALLDIVLIVLVIPWVLSKKRDPTVAVAWCLVVLLVPLLGATLFWAFGYNYVHRRVKRMRTHREKFPQAHPPPRLEAARGKGPAEHARGSLPPLARLALSVDAFPVSRGNALTLYAETERAFAGMLEDIRAAKHHVHLEFFILRPDATGAQLYDLLTEKAKAGVEVRLLYDSVGAFFLPQHKLWPLRRAGGKARAFLPVNPLRSLFQINLRNHRKIVVVDGRVAFTGGMNIGDEYLGKSPRFGYWRDTFLRLEGPAVAAIQRVFTEDWDFVAHEPLNGAAYFPDVPESGDAIVQVAESGPDQELNTIREIYFAAIVSARKRLWIASPYFVPDRGLLDALRLARHRGVDVRLLCIMRPDHYLSFFASRYYWADMLEAGARVYQYARGMMHSKMVLVDSKWAMVGSANLDNRSLHLNFEIACMIHSPDRVAELERQFQEDLRQSIRVDAPSFAARPYLSRLLENTCRLFSPVL
jgi:cardiolipin synthase